MLSSGYVVDKFGGYKDETGHSTVVALKCCMTFGVCALISSILTAVVLNFVAFAVFLWLVLFFGG